MDQTTGPTQLCVVVDLEPGTLMADLERLEELLLTLRAWADEAAGPDGDGWTPPERVGEVALAAVHRAQEALRPTQTRTDRGGPGQDWREIPPAGPKWYAADGHYELAPLSFVQMPARDVEALGAMAAELGRPDGDPDVREALSQHDEDEPCGGTDRDRVRHRLVVTAARIHGLLDLQPTPDTAALYQARQAAGEDADRLVLTIELEAAYHRTVDRINAMANLGDPLTRWAMGTRDRH